MITKINNKLINININNYKTTKEMYLNLWKELYNINIKTKSINIDNFKLYINNENIYI